MVAKISAWVIGILITLLYVSVVVAAVGNFIMLPEMAEAMGIGISGFGWFWLSFGIALPIVAYGLAWVLMRKRRAGMRLIVLAAGLAAVSAVQLEVLHLVPQAAFFA